MYDVGRKMMNKGLLFKYLLVYPMYYVVAMLLATILLAYLMDWSYILAEKLFFIFSGIMWFVCYIAHFDIFKFAINGEKSPRKRN
jgi:hypothetical protein